MNEKTWWSSHVKPHFTNPERKWIANKVQDAFNAGLPDVEFCFHGASGKIELKYAKEWPKRAETKLTFSKDKAQNLGGTGKYMVLSPGQVRNLVAWARCHGLAFVLIGIGKSWFLYDAVIFDSSLNFGMTEKEMRQLAILEGHTYQSLADIPQYLEERYGRTQDEPE